MTEAKIRESVRPVQQKSNRTEQSYIMVEWRQTSGFQATLLVLVPSGGGGWGQLNGNLASTTARCIELGYSSEGCGKCGVEILFVTESGF